MIGVKSVELAASFLKSIITRIGELVEAIALQVSFNIMYSFNSFRITRGMLLPRISPASTLCFRGDHHTCPTRTFRRHRIRARKAATKTDKISERTKSLSCSCETPDRRLLLCVLKGPFLRW